MGNGVFSMKTEATIVDVLVMLAGGCGSSVSGVEVRASVALVARSYPVPSWSRLMRSRL
jgi:hypothetical protein